MEPLSNEEKTAGTLGTSRAKRYKRPLRSGNTKGGKTEAGNNLLLATLGELQKAGFKYEIHNIKVGGRWVASIRLVGQMWTDTGNLKGSEPCKATNPAALPPA